MTGRWIVSCLLVGTVAGFAPAAGVVQKLPREGTWSRYRVTMQIADVRNLRMPRAIPKELHDNIVKTLPKAGVAEGALTVSLVGTERKGDAKLHWIEIEWAVGATKRSYRLLIPEAAFKVGGDRFKEAVRFIVKRPDAAEPEEIDDPTSRAAEWLPVRHMFPPFPSEPDQRNVPLEIAPGTGGAPIRGDTYRFRFEFTGKPPGGGPLASCRHEADYFGIVSDRAPFGGDQLWMTNGITVETGDCLTAARDDVTVTMCKQSMQISLIESGTGATSRFKAPKESSSSRHEQCGRYRFSRTLSGPRRAPVYRLDP